MTTFTLSQDQLARINALAAKRGVTSQELLSQVVGLGLTSLEYRDKRHQDIRDLNQERRTGQASLFRGVRKS